jgi:hypothetical protein
MKTWKPDTCECLVEEIYDGAEIVGGGAVLKKCDVHKGVPDEELYGVLYSNPDGENKRKNQMLSILLSQDSVKGLNLEETKKNEKGEDAGVGLKSGIEYVWHFEGEGSDRILKVEVKGAALTAEQKQDIVDLTETKYGNGKVEII